MEIFIHSTFFVSIQLPYRPLLHFPPTTLVNRSIPKKAFYEHWDLSAKQRQHFVDDIASLTWLYKLGETTVNVSRGKNIVEIDVFAVNLKRQDCPDDVFTIIDTFMPQFIVFLQCYNDEYRLLLNYKDRTKDECRPFRIIKIGLNRPREEMYERINQRVIEMVKQGLIEETLAVYDKRSLNALNTVGYKEMFDYLDGLITLDEAIREIQSNTRRYMRKQLTWFKKDPNIHWFSPNDISAIIRFIDEQDH